MRNARTERWVLGVASLAAMALLYTVASNAYRVVDMSPAPPPLGDVLRPEILPPTQHLVDVLQEVVTGVPSAREHAGHHHHDMDHLGTLLDQRVTLQASLAVSIARVLFGLVVGVPLGILAGLVMGWSRRVDDYVHPLYILVRSVPPLALITYVMLWFGHSEAHRLIPIVYAVVVTMVIPVYHGVRDLSATYLVAARALGARGRLLFARVVVPAASPAILGGLRYALALAWMTTVGVEMLMAENGIGNFLVGGGLWSSRTSVRADAAVVIVGIAALAATAWLMDRVVLLVTARLTRWVR